TIPAPLVFEAEMALARAQLKTQTPLYEKVPQPLPPQPLPAMRPGEPALSPENPALPLNPEGTPLTHLETKSDSKLASHEVAEGEGLPDNWPDPRGFTPQSPQPIRPCCQESNEPVLRHTKTYNGNNADVTMALES